jgi:serine/threonine-protein kinase RsbW
MNDGGLELTLPATAENVIVVRQAIAGVAEALGLDPSRIADLKTVVTEACNNVVLHAYEGDPGPLQVTAEPGDDQLIVEVADQGHGFRPRASEGDASLGLGLPLIAALSDSFEISGGAGHGSRTTIRFGYAPPDAQNNGKPTVVPNELEIALTPGTIVKPVLARVIGALAARAEFSMDRLADTVLLGDAVSATEGAISRTAASASRSRTRGLTRRPGRSLVEVGGAADVRDGRARRRLLRTLATSCGRSPRERLGGRVGGVPRVRGESRALLRDPLAQLRSSPAGSGRRASGRRRRARRSRSGSDPRRSGDEAPRDPVRDLLRTGPMASPYSTVLNERSSEPIRSRSGAGSSPSPIEEVASSETAWWPWEACIASRTSSSLAWMLSPISWTVGVWPSLAGSSAVAFSTLRMRSWTSRGTWTDQPRSRKWRFSSPRIVGTAKVEKAVPRSGSKRSIALTRPTLATCTRSSKGSAPPEYRAANRLASGMKRSTSSSRTVGDGSFA